jgi:Protein of unknown function (DUF2283).
MEIRYDPEADAMYIKFRAGEYEIGAHPFNCRYFHITFLRIMGEKFFERFGGVEIGSVKRWTIRYFLRRYQKV